MTTANYLILSPQSRFSLITTLQEMRERVRDEMVKKKRKPKTSSTKRRRPVFFSPEIEKMFDKMPKECQQFILKGKS